MALRHAGVLQLRRLSKHGAAAAALCVCRRQLVSTAATKRRAERESAMLYQAPNVREWMSTAIPEAVMSRKMQQVADRFVTEAEEPHSEKPSFFAADTRHCTICGERLQGGYAAHRSNFDHVSRIAVVRRALSMILTFIEQAVSSPSAPSPTARSGASPQHLEAKQASAAVSSSCFHTSFQESPLFGAAGVPPREVLFRRSHTVQEVKLVDAVVQRWWGSISRPSASRGFIDFNRLLSLSSNDMQERRWRLRFLLHFLRSRGVLRFALSLRSGDVVSRNSRVNTFRSDTFQRYEMVGDASLKRLGPDRLHVMFPADEGGMLGDLQLLVRSLDSNFGLLSVYDYLGLDEIAGVTMANNKSKSDVVEAIIGELEVLLASSDVRCGSETLSAIGPRASTVYLRAVAAHTLNELWHALLMWRIEATLHNAREFIERCVAQELSPKKGKPRRAREEAQSDIVARLPRYASMPALLPWERRHPGVVSESDEALYAISRIPARVENTLQDSARQLAPTPMPVPAAHKASHAIPGEARGAREWIAGVRSLARRLSPPPDAASSENMEAPLGTLCDTPTPAPPRLPVHVVPDLATQNCVVLVAARASL